MKHYLINAGVDWADEFDVPIYEILNEEEYRIYMYAKNKLGSLYIDKYFGSNEGWDYYKDIDGTEYGFDVLQFIPQEISDIEYSIIQKYFPQGTIDIIDDLIYRFLDYNNIKDSDIDITLENLKPIIDEYPNRI